MPMPASRSQGAWAGLLPALGLLVFTLFGALLAGLLPRADSDRFAVLAAPWQDATASAALVGQAGGAVLGLGPGGLGNLVIAHSTDRDFARAAYAAGAWLVLDGALLESCLGGGAAAPRLAGLTGGRG